MMDLISCLHHANCTIGMIWRKTYTMCRFDRILYCVILVF